MYLLFAVSSLKLLAIRPGVRTRLYAFSRNVAIMPVQLECSIPPGGYVFSCKGGGSRGGRQSSIPLLARISGMLRVWFEVRGVGRRAVAVQLRPSGVCGKTRLSCAARWLVRGRMCSYSLDGVYGPGVCSRNGPPLPSPELAKQGSAAEVRERCIDITLIRLRKRQRFNFTNPAVSCSSTKSATMSGNEPFYLRY